MRVRVGEETVTGSGLTVQVHKKSKTLTVRCEACGELLVVSEARTGPDTATALASRNAARNPCCDWWR
jgi:hypothetical protein